MSLNINASHQTEARFAAAAQKIGVDTSALFEKMIMDYLPRIESDLANASSASDHFYFKASTEQFQNALAQLSSMNEDLPTLSDEAFDRGNIYEDRS